MFWSSAPQVKPPLPPPTSLYMKAAEKHDYRVRALEMARADFAIFGGSTEQIIARAWAYETYLMETANK